MKVVLTNDKSLDLVQYTSFQNIDYNITLNAEAFNEGKGVLISGSELIRANANPKMINPKFKYIVGNYKIIL